GAGGSGGGVAEPRADHPPRARGDGSPVLRPLAVERRAARALPGRPPRGGARGAVPWARWGWTGGRPDPVAAAGLAEDLVDLTSVVRDADELLSVSGSVALEGGLVLVRLGEASVGG